MTEIQEAQQELDSALISQMVATKRIEGARELLKEAQKPKIQLEHMGVYELENEDVIQIRKTKISEWVAVSFTTSKSWYINEDGTSHHGGDSPIVKHIGKIVIVAPKNQLIIRPIGGSGVIGMDQIVDPLNIKH